MTREILERYLESPKEERIAILDSLSKEASEKVADLLLDIYDREEDRDLLKNIRRILFLFRTRGVKVKEKREKGSPVFRPKEKKYFFRGFISNYDCNLNRIGIILIDLKKNLLLVTHGIMNMIEGLTQMWIKEVARSEYLSWFDEKRSASAKERIFISEVPPSYAFFVIEEAQRISGKFSEEIGFLKKMILRADFDSKHGGPSEVYSLFREDVEEIPLERVIGHPIFRDLFLRWDGIERNRDEYERIGESTIILPGYLREEKRREYLKGLMEREDMKFLHEKMRRILEDYALMLYSLGEKPFAGSLISALKNEANFKSILLYFIEKSINREFKEDVDRIILTPKDYLRSIYGKISS